MTGHLEKEKPGRGLSRRVWIGGVALALLAGGVGLRGVEWGQGAAAAPAPAAPPPPAVTVSTPLRRDLAAWTTFTGQFSAVDYVEIRAQVSGYLTEIHFTDGQIVHKGDLLFVIDPRPFEIQLQQAQAQLLTANAQLDLANKEIVRTTALHASEFASTELLDQRVQQQHNVVAAVEQAKAAIRSAALNLDFTRVTAPISGRVSMHRASVGNLILGGQSVGPVTLLTTIVSLDPIHLDFDMSENDYLAYRRAQPAGATPAVEAQLSDEHDWPHRGTLDFLDNQLDRSSGTIHARATLPNPDLFIAPGQFARLRLPVSKPRAVLLVPDDALVTDQSNKLLMTVAADGTVVPKLVQIGPLSDGLRVITGGLAPTDRIVVNGLMRSRPGSKVTPQPGTIAPPAQQG